MQAVKTRERDHTHGSIAADEPGHVGTGQGRLAGDLGCDDGAPIGAVVPGQEIARQTVGERKQQQHDAGHPGSFARLFIRSIHEHLDHVKHHHHDQHAGAPVVETADETTAGQLGEDVSQAVVGVAGGRRVVERQQDTGEGLDEEEEQRNAAENLAPTAGSGDLLVEEIADGGLDPGAVVEPLGDPGADGSHALPSVDSRSLPSRSLFLSTLVS